MSSQSWIIFLFRSKKSQKMPITEAKKYLKVPPSSALDFVRRCPTLFGFARLSNKVEVGCGKWVYASVESLHRYLEYDKYHF